MEMFFLNSETQDVSVKMDMIPCSSLPVETEISAND